MKPSSGFLPSGDFREQVNIDYLHSLRQLTLTGGAACTCLDYVFHLGWMYVGLWDKLLVKMPGTIGGLLNNKSTKIYMFYLILETHEVMGSLTSNIAVHAH